MPKPSPELAMIIGESETTPDAAVRGVWEYVQARGLQSPDAKSFRVDETLKAIFGKGPTVTLIEAAWQMARHLGLPASEPDLVKLEVRLDDGTVETPWAKKVGENLYRSYNIPFLAYRLSAGDIVEAEPQARGFPVVKRVAEKSGNRTIRVMFAAGRTCFRPRGSCRRSVNSVASGRGRDPS
jgi:hypothetical protein